MNGQTRTPLGTHEQTTRHVGRFNFAPSSSLSIEPWTVREKDKSTLNRKPSTLWIRRIEQRKWNRGRNRLPKLVQTIVTSIPFPVFKPLYPQAGIDNYRGLDVTVGCVFTAAEGLSGTFMAQCVSRRDNERRLEIEVFIRKHLTSVFQATSSHRRPSRRVLNYFCLPSFLPSSCRSGSGLTSGREGHWRDRESVA